MIFEPIKSVTDNPFMDNILYYSKFLTLNSTIKDQDEALSYETKDSLYNADVLISCIEGNATYDIFKTIPKEILEKYIALSTNLDIYAKNPQWLKNHMNSYQPTERKLILDRLSRLARSTYIDHYDMMTKYIDSVGSNWLIDNEELYKLCKLNKATYKDLFDHIPLKTVLRIIRTYLNSHGYLDLAIIWDPDSELTLSDLEAFEKAATSDGKTQLDIYYSNSIKNLLLDDEYIKSSIGYSSNQSQFMNQFMAYINSRSDSAILTELSNISKAMRDVFISHYEMMKERAYFSYKTNDDIEDSTQEPAWMGYTYDRDLYNKCKSNEVMWYDLWDYFPEYDKYEILTTVISKLDVDEYNLMESVNNVNYYLDHYTTGATAKRLQLNHLMIEAYINNYQIYFNKVIYDQCIYGELDIYDMYEYLPIETLKMILNTEFTIATNLDAYASSKTMLDSYINTLDPNDALNLKNSITKDMLEWYPKHHNELNNYYRAFIGLPPLDQYGKECEDTLYHTWIDVTQEYKEFGSIFIDMCPTDMYEASHWRQPLYKFDAHDINILNSLGIIDSWVEACGGNIHSIRYRYLKYLGDSKLDLYTCRKAMNFDLIGLPSIDDEELTKKFKDVYVTCREYVLRCVYDDAYKFKSDYYNKFIIMFILLNVVIDLCGSISDFIINKEVFDSRSIMFYFESAGIPYYDEIPLKYQKAMLKNLNNLIKYKSSTKNMIDICKLFGFSDTKVYWYYMMKSVENDEDNNILPCENNSIDYSLDDVYVVYENGNIKDCSGRTFISLSNYPYYNSSYYTKEISILNNDGTTSTKRIIDNSRDVYVYDKYLEQMIPLKDSSYFTSVKAKMNTSDITFVRVPVMDDLAKYKNDGNYIVSYDDMTQEQYWDGGLKHEALKQELLDYKFNAVKTKYISIDSVENLTAMAFETSYFYNMLFDKLYSEDNLKFNINYIKSGHEFRLADVIFFMFAMMYYYYGLEDKIMYSPTQILYMKGYAFSKAINEIFNDDRYFVQSNSNGVPLIGDEKYECFNINKEIAERNYNYKERFDELALSIKSFNLDADIDGLEQWINDRWHMSLSDFIVSTDTEEWGKVLTVMHYYSLNNSYYNKSLFSGNMTPIQFNNVLKYAYDYSILNKIERLDINGISHTYIKETAISETTDTYGYIDGIVALVSKAIGYYTYDELFEKLKRVSSLDQLKDYAYILTKIFFISDSSIVKELITKITTDYYDLVVDNYKDVMYILDNSTYASRYENSDKSQKLALYNAYIKDGNSLKLAHSQYYIHDESTNSYNLLISGLIYVRNSDGIFTFAINNVYKSDKYGNMNEIDYDKYTVYDEEVNAKVLNMDEYYIQNENGIWILDPNNCYMLIEINGEEQYVLAKDIDNYVVKYSIDENECYIRTEDGHFILYNFTDFFIRTHDNEMVYSEMPLYVKVNYETEIQDQDDPSIYYRLLSDITKESNISISTDKLYIKDSYGNFIPEEDLLTPKNTWFYDEIDEEYHLIIDSQFNYIKYEEPLNVLYILARQPNYDYFKYTYEAKSKTYILVSENNRYTFDSNTKNILLLYNKPTYTDTNKVIVILNREYTTDTQLSISSGGSNGTNITTSGYISDSSLSTYDASLTDGVWDENDWFYDDNSEDDMYNNTNENIWYYRNPYGSNTTDSMIDNTNGIIHVTNLASGFYFDSTSFLGNSELSKNETYYLSFDVISNFDGEVQMYCTFDDSVTTKTDRSYEMVANVEQHISQKFTSLHDGKPYLRFLRYVSDDSSISIGNYLVISNVKIIKASSEDYIPTDLVSIDELIKIYKTNSAIYKWLKLQLRTTHDKKKYDIYKKMYDSLMISSYNKDIFRLSQDTYALTYTEFLQTRDVVLYEILLDLKKMDYVKMRTTISEYIIEVIYAMNEYLTNIDLTHIYSFLPASSSSFIQQYLTKIISWFKSWKVQLLGTNVMYKLGSSSINTIYNDLNSDDDADEYMLHFLDDEKYNINLYINHSALLFKDNLKINPLDGISPDGTPYEDKYDLDGDYLRSDTLKFYHRLRIIEDSGDMIEYNDGSNLLLPFNNTPANMDILNAHTPPLEEVDNEPTEIIQEKEDDEDSINGQIIDRINLLSYDYAIDDTEDEDSIDFNFKGVE